MIKFQLGPRQQKLVNALRSGDYKQGYGTLYNIIEDSYCCLGVTCKITDKWQNEKFINGLDLTVDIERDTQKYFKFKSPVGRFYDEKSYTDILYKDRYFGCLVDINDSRSISFEEIADIIEEYAHLLFEEPV